MKKVLILIITPVILFSCQDGMIMYPMVRSKEVKIDSLPGQCAYLTKDAKGNAVLSWVRMINDSIPQLCYAVSSDGKTFGKTVVIPNSDNMKAHNENLPKIIFKPSGEIIAVWGAGNPNPNNKYSGLVFYTQSFDEGKTWTRPARLVKDTAGYDQRYFDMVLLPGGEVAIAWLDNRKTNKSDGSALYLAVTNGKNGFENERLISQSCCQCCRTDLFADKKGGIHVVYRGIVQDSIRDMVHIVSTNGGKTFSSPVRISNDNWVIDGCPHTGPAMTENNDGIHFAWFTGGKKRGCFYTKSTDNGKSFVMNEAVSEDGSHPQLAATGNGEVVIVWDEVQTLNNKTGKRIRLQRRGADGKNEETSFISDGDFASYPVITALADEKEVMVAYTVRENNKSYIAYQSIEMKKPVRD